MTYLSWLLMWFEACSGLRINLDKSELILVGRDLGPFLRSSFGAPFKFVTIWDDVQERF